MFTAVLANLLYRRVDEHNLLPAEQLALRRGEGDEDEFSVLLQEQDVDAKEEMVRESISGKSPSNKPEPGLG
jgi:hypothetical protein